MRKKLDTRFPAARIKKIMQADEDVGKIAMAVPVLVSKALELFLQDLCDRTYDITVQRGAKTVSSLHLRHCVQSYNEFDFLKEVVSKVPDYGHSDSAPEISKRRKVGVNESNDSDEELKKNNLQETSHATSSSRGKGRGRGRGRGRPSKASLAEREAHQDDVEPSPNSVQQNTTQTHSPGKQIMDNINSELKESPTENRKAEDGVISSDMRSFDLNAGVLDEGSEKVALSFAAPPPTTSAASGAPTSDAKGEVYPELSEMDRMAVDHVQFAQLSSRLDEDEEDYDEEG